MTTFHGTYKLQPSRGLLSPADLATLRANPLLRPGSDNQKVRKGLTAGRGIAVMTLSLAPAWLSGYQMCPYASPACGAMRATGEFDGFCVAMSGNGRYPSTVQARIRKARYFIEQHDEFVAHLVAELAAFAADPRHAGKIRAVRLNTFSDIPYERVPCVRDGITYAGIPQAFPEIVFYDYTKDVSRIRRGVPANVHLTFSLSESNDSHAADALARGYNVAVVFHTTRGRTLPATFAGRPVLDGDVDDFRFLDAAGVVVGLKAKGSARADCSGFVRSPADELEPARPLTLAGRPAITLALAAD